MTELKGVCVGAGYFSHFQYEAWNRIGEVEITAICNRDRGRGEAIMDQFGVARHYTDFRRMLETEKPDFVDIITPPETHRELTRIAAERGVHVMCQKPLAPTYSEAKALVADAARAGVRLMVHENFRFQPWHRQLKRLLTDGAIGQRIFSLNFRTRMGDGWGSNAYLARQPYFREYPRLLVYETGVHFIDTFRYLAGEVSRVAAWLRRLNDVIQGEDCGLLVFEFDNHAVGSWDANRYNEPNYPEPRYTFGECLIEGEGGSLRLYADGRITRQSLGEQETAVDYRHERRSFAGDCCYFTQRHFVDQLIGGGPFETDGTDYLRTLAVQEAVYRAAETGQVTAVCYDPQTDTNTNAARPQPK